MRTSVLQPPASQLHPTYICRLLAAAAWFYLEQPHSSILAADPSVRRSSVRRRQQGKSEAASVSLLALFNGPPWYSSVPQKLVANPEPIDSPCSTRKSKQWLKHLDEELVGWCTRRRRSHHVNLAWTGPCSSPSYLQMCQCSLKARRPVDDAVFQLGKIFFEAIHIPTIHVKQIPALAYFRIFNLFFSTRMCCWNTYFCCFPCPWTTRKRSFVLPTAVWRYCCKLLQIVKHTAVNPALNAITNPHYLQHENSYLPFKKDVTLWKH